MGFEVIVGRESIIVGFGVSVWVLGSLWDWGYVCGFWGHCGT